MAPSIAALRSLQSGRLAAAGGKRPDPPPHDDCFSQALRRNTWFQARLRLKMGFMNIHRVQHKGPLHARSTRLP